jgi:hypothetical protein
VGPWGFIFATRISEILHPLTCSCEVDVVVEFDEKLEGRGVEEPRKLEGRGWLVVDWFSLVVDWSPLTGRC